MKLKSNNVMLEKLFFKLLPVQVLVVLMSSVNTIIDGAIAGRYIDALTVGVVGLFFPMLNILNAFSNVLLGGTTVLCGRFMGSGDMEKTNGIFSLNLTCAFVVGAVVTVISFIIPEHLASILGARGDLVAPLVSYITGYAIGIIPLLLSQQISSFLQLERQTTLGYIGVIAMIISNVSMDILLVASFNMGIWGLALATSITNWIYFLILVSYYFTKRAQLHFDIRNSLWDSLPEVIKVGFPGALLILCLAFRGMVLNRIVLFYGAESGLSAMSAYNMTNGLFISYCIGNGSVVRMLSSIFIGEEDKDSLKQLLKIVFTKALALSCGIGAVVFVISPFLASVFFPDKSTEAYALTRYLFMIFSVSIPLILICQICTNYLQAGKHNLYINFLSVFDGFVSMIVVSLLLAPFMGILGIWFANPIGIILTILTTPIYCIIFWHHIPRSMDEWLFMKPEFGVSDEYRLDIEINNLEQVTNTSEKVQTFCEKHNVPRKPAYYSALCIEEMAGNVVLHGFTMDKKKHTVRIRVVYRNNSMLLRIKDDCIPFDPKERADLVSTDDPLKNIGIKMIYRIADEITYQNMLGLNMLTIIINHNQGKEI